MGIATNNFIAVLATLFTEKCFIILLEHSCPSLESPWVNPNLLIITDTDIDWVDLADDIRHEYYVVDNLRPSHGYKFRVLARNKFGWSIPSIPSGIVMTPSTGASKAEFYDALQALQVRISNRQQPLL